MFYVSFLFIDEKITSLDKFMTKTTDTDPKSVSVVFIKPRLYRFQAVLCAS